jgi:hypothetical protein
MIQRDRANDKNTLANPQPHNISSCMIIHDSSKPPVMRVIRGALALRNTCGCRSGYLAVRFMKVFTVDNTAPVGETGLNGGDGGVMGAEARERGRKGT